MAQLAVAGAGAAVGFVLGGPVGAQVGWALGGVAGTLKVLPKDVPARVSAVLDQVKKLERELAALKGKLASAQGDDMLAQALDIKGAKVLAAKLEGADINTLRETMDKLKDKLKSAAVVLASVAGGRAVTVKSDVSRTMQFRAARIG